MRVYLNAIPLDLDPGTDVRGAITAHDPVMAEKVAAGLAYVTDARGIELPLEAPLTAGSILRVVVSARRPAPGGDADADA